MPSRSDAPSTKSPMTLTKKKELAVQSIYALRAATTYIPELPNEMGMNIAPGALCSNFELYKMFCLYFMELVLLT